MNSSGHCSIRSKEHQYLWKRCVFGAGSVHVHLHHSDDSQGMHFQLVCLSLVGGRQVSTSICLVAEVFPAAWFCWLLIPSGYRIPWSCCAPLWYVQEQPWCNVPDDAEQYQYSANHPAGNYLFRWRWEPTTWCAYIPNQLQVQHWVRCKTFRLLYLVSGLTYTTQFLLAM